MKLRWNSDEIQVQITYFSQMIETPNLDKMLFVKNKFIVKEFHCLGRNVGFMLFHLLKL